MAGRYQSHGDYRRPSLRQRAVSFSLAIALELLVVIALLTLAPKLIAPPHEERPLSVFGLTPAPEPAAQRTVTERHAARTSRQKAAAPHPPTPHKPVVVRNQDVSLPGVIPMDLASTDISKIAKAGKAADAGDTGDEAGSAPAYGPGEGSGGERLYRVAWYREPTDAELRTYMPPSGAPPGSWAELSCTMIADYHVENCRSLGESPVGSGLAKAMRLASWQFLVRPPRVGNRVLLGSHVRIHFDFGKTND